MKKFLLLPFFISILIFNAKAQDGMGIGNNNPQEMLDVSGAIKLGTTTNTNAGTIRWNGANFQGYDGTQWVNLDGAGGADSDWTISGVNQYSAVTGNVGIGTTSPTARLEVVNVSGNSIKANHGIFASGTGTDSGFTFNDVRMYQDSDDKIKWTTYGSPNIGFTYDTNGNVGIGTTSPTNKLHISGSGHTGTNINAGNGFISYLDFSENGTVRANIFWNGVGDFLEVNSFTGNTVVNPNGGNVGIGSFTPGAKLEVNGQVKITGGTPGANKVLTSDATGLATWVDPATLISNDGDWTVSGNNQYSAVTGNVGIGTTTPQQKLTLSDDNTPVFRLDRSGTNAWDWEMYSTSGGRLTFRGGSDNVGTSLSDRLTILGDGNVGIGTISPDALLNIEGTSHFEGVSYFEANVGVGTASPQQHLTVSDPNTPVIRLDRTAGGTSWDWEMYSTSGGRLTFRGGSDNVGVSLTDYFTILGDGNVGIGINAPTAKLEVAGQVKITGGTPGANKILTSDATGLATWVDPSSLVDNAAFTTTSGVTSNAPGTYASDDFVFGSPQLDDNGNTTNDGRFYFDKSKAAFRAGIVTGVQWDAANVGDQSIAMGTDVTASGLYGTAIGHTATASGIGSVALGGSTTASGGSSTAMGFNSVASGDYSTAIGRLAEASGRFSSAIGENTYAKSAYEVVVGRWNTDYTPANANSWDSSDRLFVVGNGIGAVPANRSNALTIYKDGTMNINDAYDMPTADGTAGQVLTTNGSGVTSWSTPAIASSLADADNDTKIQVEETSDDDIIRFDVAGSERWIMTGSRIEPAIGGKNVFIGENVAVSHIANPAYHGNIGLGTNALNSLTASIGNIAIGHSAMASNQSENHNIAIGYDALTSFDDGGNNIAMGAGALGDLQVGHGNVAIGIGALGANTSGISNVALGRSAGANATGNGHIFIGVTAGLNATGSNKLYIDNTSTVNPLIYGEFDNDLLRINGTLRINNAYSFPTVDGTNGYVMTTDGAGTVAWTDPANISDGDWTAIGNDQYSAVSGNVGIGTTTPTAKLEIASTNDGDPLLRFAMPRTWLFEQVNSGSTTRLQLRSETNSKVFDIVSPDESSTAASFFARNAADGYGEVHLVAEGGRVGIGTTSPERQVNIGSATGGQLLFSREDGTTTTNEVMGEILFDNTDNSMSTSDAAVVIRAAASQDQGNSNKGGYLSILTKNNVGSGTAATERMRITAEGSIGVGTTNPVGKLDVTGSSHTGMNIDAGTNTNSYIDFRENGTLRGNVFWDGVNDVFRINSFGTNTGINTNGGNVGIGTGTPAAKLDVAGTAAMNDNQLRLRGGADGNHYLSYIGGSFDGAKLTGFNNVILNTVSGGDALIVTGNRVGIGTASPIAPLHVENQANASYGDFTFYARNQYTGHPNSPTSCCGGTVNGVSIHASGRVMASEFDAFSDARIKNVISLSNSEEDLNKLLAIEITDYRMKDEAKDHKAYKKVIAQQVEEVYPQAVSTITDVIPDIYSLATIENGFVTIDTEVEVGDKVRLILESGKEMVTVTEVSDGGFQTDSELNGDVFVYGREVNDFRTVDYEAISMLNVSATQELFKMIKQLQDENEDLKSTVSGFKAMAEDIEKLKEWTKFKQEASNDQ